jgi:hypothetical protein
LQGFAKAGIPSQVESQKYSIFLDFWFRGDYGKGMSNAFHAIIGSALREFFHRPRKIRAVNFLTYLAKTNNHFLWTSFDESPGEKRRENLFKRWQIRSDSQEEP